MFDVEQQGESARLTSEHDQETHFRCFNGFRIPGITIVTQVESGS
jgi:hypothetical protein